MPTENDRTGNGWEAAGRSLMGARLEEIADALHREFRDAAYAVYDGKELTEAEPRQLEKRLKNAEEFVECELSEIVEGN